MMDHASPPVLIEDIETQLLRVRPSSPWEDATMKVASLEYVAVTIRSASGRTGLGLCYTVGQGGLAVEELIKSEFAPLLVGFPTPSPPQATRKLLEHIRRSGPAGLASLGAAAIDIALWDLLANEMGVPLSVALGGSPSPQTVYASGIDLHLPTDELAELLRSYLAAGYKAVKIKVGKPSLEEDLERVAAARDAVGDHVTLLLDANEAWDVGEAVRRVRAFEPYHPGWIEEPMRAEDIEGHAHLRRRCGVPVAVGESLFSPSAFLSYLRAEAVDVLQPDIARVGGLSSWLQVASLAQIWNKPVAPHYLMELSVHALCAVPNGLILENVMGGGLIELGVVRGDVQVMDGMSDPGNAPGHGLERPTVEAAPAVGEKQHE